MKPPLLPHPARELRVRLDTKAAPSDDRDKLTEHRLPLLPPSTPIACRNALEPASRQSEVAGSLAYRKPSKPAKVSFCQQFSLSQPSQFLPNVRM